MVIIRFSGGIGNQMLQYAFGQFLKTRSIVVKYDLSLYSLNEIHNGFLLDEAFSLTIERASKQEIDKVRKNIQLKNRIYYYLYKHFGIQLSTFHLKDTELLWKTKVLNYDIDSLTNKLSKNDYYLEGSWMDYRFFEISKLQYGNYFIFNDKIKKNNIVADLVYAIVTNESTAIHIRRGDYLKDKIKDYFDVCTKEYYLKCVEKSCLFDKSQVYYLFTDDVEWVKINLIPHFVENSFVIIQDYNLKDYEELYLMSLCKNHIISNSTFSWWGVVLSENCGLTYCPQKWFSTSKQYRKVIEYSDKHVQKHFVPSGWLKSN